MTAFFVSELTSEALRKARETVEIEIFSLLAMSLIVGGLVILNGKSVKRKATQLINSRIPATFPVTLSVLNN